MTTWSDASKCYKLPFIALLVCASIFAPPSMRSQEIKTFGLPNGLEVQTRHLANTGTVHARLVFSWAEGTARVPVGTAWTMSKALPALGCNGMGRGAFQSQKDHDGVLSGISAGRGWIAWDFDSAPANADLMFQTLADESLRPLWPGGGALSQLLKKIWEESHFLDSREEAAHLFKAAAKDRDVAQLPDSPIEHDQFILLWASNVRMPMRAVLRISGDIESISLLRLVNQHFGPWPGISLNSPSEVEALPEKPKRFLPPSELININSAVPVVWMAIGGFASASDEKATKALVPWLAKAGLNPSDAVISSWDASVDGSWVQAIGKAGMPMEDLHSHVLSLLRQLATQEVIDKALKAMADSHAASALRPARAFDAIEIINALDGRNTPDLMTMLLGARWDWLTYGQWW